MFSFNYSFHAKRARFFLALFIYVCKPRKPSSVPAKAGDDHLSRTAVTDRLVARITGCSCFRACDEHTGDGPRPFALRRIGFTLTGILTHPPVGSYPTFSPLLPLQGAVLFCCTFPEVAFGGRYPLSLFVGARTFLRLPHCCGYPRPSVAADIIQLLN